jgi:hypothetical protein
MLGSRRAAPHRSILFSQTVRLYLAPFDDQGYPRLIVVSANCVKLDPVAAFRVRD